MSPTGNPLPLKQSPESPNPEVVSDENPDSPTLEEFLQVASEIVPGIIRRLGVSPQNQQDLAHDIYLVLIDRWYNEIDPARTSSLRPFIARLALLYGLRFRVKYFDNSRLGMPCDHEVHCTVHASKEECLRAQKFIAAAYPQAVPHSVPRQSRFLINGTGNEQHIAFVSTTVANLEIPDVPIDFRFLFADILDADILDPAQTCMLRDLKTRLLELSQDWPRKRQAIFKMVMEGASLEEMSRTLGYNCISTKGYWTVRYHLKQIRTTIQRYLDKGLL